MKPNYKAGLCCEHRLVLHLQIMKNAPIEIRGGKWLPSIEGETPDEDAEIWVDQTLVDTKRQAELHGLAMLSAYRAGRKYERNRMKKFLENAKGLPSADEPPSNVKS
jgi:hypothetical protein